MPLLVRSEPYRDFDRLFQQLMGDSNRRVTSVGIPMDAYRKQDQFLLQFDVPGVDSESIELTVDNNTLPAIGDDAGAVALESLVEELAGRAAFRAAADLGDQLVERSEAEQGAGGKKEEGD